MMENHNYRNLDKLEEKMRTYQSIPYALIGGFVLAFLGATLWAGIVVTTGYQVGLIAILLGVIVGVGVRYFGAGYDPVFSAIGTGMTLLSCLLGSLFSQIGFAMVSEGLSITQMLSFLNFSKVKLILLDSFTPFDLVFYAIAIFQGMKLSRRVLEPHTDPTASLEPEYSNLRGPLIAVLVGVMICFSLYIKFKSPTQSTYFYETGEKMSIGAYASGVEDGEWEYLYKNGQTESKGSYKAGKQEGEWNIFYENGQLANSLNFKDGLETGKALSYYNDGSKMIECNYENGRLNGESESYHEDGVLANKGKYRNDREQGEWVYFYANGNKSAIGSLENGERTGIWKFYYENGNLQEILEYEDS